ncbi:transmembrane protein, putative [Medicago truncatula]|uniref:Transmembrane protein, putative n=1 Tax=Medicago truncatula TaxID=3880 RepID=A0A072VHA8_MEDTR|nr:transmembrane protein, putative [Medicago truncatula]
MWQSTLPVVPQTPPFFSLNPKDGNACVNNFPRHFAIQISLQRRSHRLSIVSKTFRSTADSDIVWNHFLLLSDTQFMASISHNRFLTKKAIYLALSYIHFSIIIDHAFLVFNMIAAQEFKNYLVMLSVGVNGGHYITNIGCLEPYVRGRKYNNKEGL